jgi:hypothetical protein
MTDADNVMPIRLRPLGPRRDKKKADPTNAERSRRWRQRRKEMESAVAEAVAQRPIETLSQEALPAVAEPILADVAPISGELEKTNDFRVSDTPADRCATRHRTRSVLVTDVLAISSALTLTGVSAYLSVRGLAVLFPGVSTLILGAAMESGKLCTVAFLVVLSQLAESVGRI